MISIDPSVSFTFAVEASRLRRFGRRVRQYRCRTTAPERNGPRPGERYQHAKHAEHVKRTHSLASHMGY
jgi:hypothetical protein